MFDAPRSRPVSGSSAAAPGAPQQQPTARAPVPAPAAAPTTAVAELALPLRQFTMVSGQKIDPLFLCPLCQDSWADPVELVPCGDIFCHGCIAAARAQHAAQPMIMENFQCPLCQTVVQSEKKPNRMLLNSVLSIEVECRFCQWRGTREASEQQAHNCSAGTRILKPARRGSGSAAVPDSAGAGGGRGGGGGGAASLTARSDVGLAECTSTAPSPSKALPTRRVGAQGSTSTPPTTPSAAAAASATSLSAPPPQAQQRPQPRRALREIEDGYVPIGDDPDSVTSHIGRTSLSHVSNDGGGGGVNSYDFAMADASASGMRGFNDGSPRLVTSPLQSAGSAQATPNRSHAAAVGGSHSNERHGASGGSSSTPTPGPQEPWRRYWLTQIEYDQLVGIFMMFDDGTGQLRRSQLRALCFCMNFVQHEEDVDVVFQSMDQGGKGFVSQDDFLRWLSSHRPDPAALFGLSQFEYTDALLQFRSVDPEYNGVIDLNAFTSLCIANGYAQTREQAVQYFLMCDERHTGYISLQQFLQNLQFMKTGRDAPHTPGANSYGGGAATYTRGASLTSSGAPGGGLGAGVPARSFAGSTLSGSPQVSDYFTGESGQPPQAPQQQLASPRTFARGPQYGVAAHPAPAPQPNPPRRPPATWQNQQQQQQSFSLVDNPTGSNGVPASASTNRVRTGAGASTSSIVATPNSLPPQPLPKQQQSARLHRQGARSNRGDEECAVM